MSTPVRVVKSTLLKISLAIALSIVFLFAVRPAAAQSYTLLYSFNGQAGGRNPWSPLIRNSQGDLLGTTYGGASGAADGVFFKFKMDGDESLLGEFDGSGGRRPSGLITRDAEGNFYGTTTEGGASAVGTVYKKDEVGNFTTLFSFHQFVGQVPGGGVILDTDGNLYGTTETGGGSGTNGVSYDGVVFKLSSTGTYTVLHHFIAGTTDGAAPDSSLLRDSLGNLYGTTAIGGNYRCTSGCGTVFKITADGTERVMHRFTGKPDDGAYPEAGLIRDHAGNFYGTTTIGGTTNTGTVFKIDTTGTETVLYSFQAGSDGGTPMASPVMDSEGNLYGTTSSGGTYGDGTVFKIDTSGAETILHSFAGPPNDGREPYTGLTLGADGNLYGTTFRGGTANAGTIFEITP
jgi:uncharacterized repeat protein (TIGR03803 family)